MPSVLRALSVCVLVCEFLLIAVVVSGVQELVPGLLNCHSSTYYPFTTRPYQIADSVSTVCLFPAIS